MEMGCCSDLGPMRMAVMAGRPLFTLFRHGAVPSARDTATADDRPLRDVTPVTSRASILATALAKPMKILVPCDRVVLSGGLLRFDRVAREISQYGHEMVFAVLGASPPERPSDVPVVDLAGAAQQTWDCVMVPGAGFPAATIEKFGAFRQRQFGLRMQHVLNDPTRRDAFLQVNRALDPHVVVFNNEHWPPASHKDFRADRTHVLIGAVDTNRFFPTEGRAPGRTAWVIGGLANKNPIPLVEAVSDCNGMELVLFGNDRHGLRQRYPEMIAQGRLTLRGAVVERDLPGLYRNFDCVVATEFFAGWSNLSAEAMASGVPVICTRAGTLAFARDGETALVVDDPTPETLRTRLEWLRANRSLALTLARNARTRIEKFDVATYARSLLELCRRNGVESRA